MKERKTIPATGIGPLTEFDWNFDRVPNDELGTCELWEYARELGFIRSIRQRCATVAKEPWVRGRRDEVVGKDFRLLFNSLGRAAILFQERFYCFGGHPNYYDAFRSPFPRTWQSLSPRSRKIVIETATWDVTKLRLSHGFIRGTEADLDALVRQFRSKSFMEAFGKDRVSGEEFFHAGNKLRAVCPNLLDARGRETLVVQIDWGRFKNEELVKLFAEWLRENDPPGIARPDKRGHKRISHRVNLERLGILRLLYRFTLPELRKKLPAAWNRYNTPNRRWRRDAEMARDHFHELFPFLPKGELPASWPPKA